MMISNKIVKLSKFLKQNPLYLKKVQISKKISGYLLYKSKLEKAGDNQEDLISNIDSVINLLKDLKCKCEEELNELVKNIESTQKLTKSKAPLNKISKDPSSIQETFNRIEAELDKTGDIK